MTVATSGSTTSQVSVQPTGALCWMLNATNSDPCGTVPSGATTYTYDGAGNETASTPSSGTGEKLAYNPIGQTTSMAAPGGSALAMTYTGSNSIQRTAVGSTTLTNNAFGVASSTTAGATTYFTYNPTKEPNTLASIEIGASPYYYVYDALGNVVALVGDEGALRASYTYSPYGTTTASSGTEASANPFRFQGGYTDSNGWVKFGDRYYNPTTMLWTQPDPKAPALSDPTSYLLYSFDGNDPINKSDSSGADDTEDIGLGAADGPM